MKILNVHTQYFESHLILDDFKSVTEALGLFASGDQLSASFASRQSRHIQYHLETENVFQRNCGYLGPGVFKDTTIEVIKTDSPTAPYLLHLFNSRRSDKPDVVLARRMGAELGLDRIEIQIELAAEGTEFEIDFKTIFNHLRREAQTSRPEAMIKAIMTGKPKYHEAGHAVLAGYPARVTLRVDQKSVGPFFDHEKYRPAWTSDNTFIRGPLLRTLDDRERFYNPRVLIGVTATLRHRPAIRQAWIPITNPQVKSRVRQTADRIVNTFPDALITSPIKGSASV